MYGQNPGPYRQGFYSTPNNSASYRRDFSTGRMGGEPAQPQNYDDQEGPNNAAQGPTPQLSREPQHNGSYVVVPPNQAKRDKLLTMAKKEEEEYDRFLESQRPGPIHLTPKKLGGQASEAKARQQQQLTQSQSKLQKKLQRDEYRRRQRQEEEAKLQQMKDHQRKKAEKLEEKKCQEDKERRERWHKSMLQKNSEFLDQLSKSASSYSSYDSYEPSAWGRRSAYEEDDDWNEYAEQNEDSIYQLTLKESIKTKREEDQRRERVDKNQPWQHNTQKREEDQRREKVEKNQLWQTSQQSYRQQLQEEEERKLQQMKEEHCREKKEEEQRRQEAEKTRLWEASRQSRISYKQQQKEEEERKLQEIKEEQRRKSELLEMKRAEEEKQRILSQQEERRRVNNAFLDKLQERGTRQHEYSGISNTWA